MSRDRKPQIYSGRDVEGIRAAAKVTAEVLERLCQAVVPGMTTFDVDMLAAEYIRASGAKSADLGYEGFPCYMCISVNEEVCHAVARRDHIIQPGDLVSLDLTLNLNGYCGDTCRTICAGMPPSPTRQKLMQVTEDALWAGIAQAYPGKTTNDIGRPVQSLVEANGFSIVRDFVGHGIGRHMHEAPEVRHYYTPGQETVLRPGMCICIEPMVNTGTWRVVVDRKDGWTVRTADQSLSCQFEHQVLITHNKPEILTCLNNPRTV